MNRFNVRVHSSNILSHTLTPPILISHFSSLISLLFLSGVRISSLPSALPPPPTTSPFLNRRRRRRRKEAVAAAVVQAVVAAAGAVGVKTTTRMLAK